MNEASIAAQDALRHFDLGSEFVLEDNPTQGQSNSTWLLHSGNSEFFVKHHHGYDGIDHVLAEHHLLAWLADQQLSFSVPVPKPTKSGQSLAVTDSGSFSIQPRIMGTPIDVHNLDRIAVFGAALGELLGVLARYRPPRQIRRSLRNVMFPIELSTVSRHALVNEECRPQPFSSDPHQWLSSEYDTVDQLLDTYRPQLRAQFTHGDYVPSNVLSTSDSVSGILDFECASMQYRALDIAMALLFTVRYWTAQDSEATIAALADGFRSNNALRDTEIRALPGLMRLQLLASTAWWLALAHERRLPAKELCLRLERGRDHAEWIGRNSGMIQACMQG